MKKQMKNNDKTKKVLIYASTSVILPAFTQMINKYLEIKFVKNNPFLSFVTLASICALITLLVVNVIQRIATKKDFFVRTNVKINEINKEYQIRNASTIYPLFDLSEENKKINLSSGKYKQAESNKNKKKKNYIYWALSAKKYLNWIDYVYLSYLKKIKTELKCSIIICLHFPDYIKECKVEDVNNDPNDLENEYKVVCNYYKKFIRTIVGKDTLILEEEEFYLKYAKKYIKDFRNVYSSYLLYFGHKIGDASKEECIDYQTFKRRLSHVESAFPIWMMAKKRNSDRTYVLDNKVSLEIWDYEPLKKVRENNDIYFIHVNSIIDGAGKRINVHKKENAVNFTDSPLLIEQKLSNLDEETKEIMIYLLDEKLRLLNQDGKLTIRNKDEKLHSVIMAIIEEYRFQSEEFDFNNYLVGQGD